MKYIIVIITFINTSTNDCKCIKKTAFKINKYIMHK